MKLEQGWNQLTVNLTTRRDGNSAMRIAGDQTTSVYFGGLEASVTLLDLHLRVEMDPDDGNWRDVAWARQRALEAALAPPHAEKVLTALAAHWRDAGVRSGREDAQRAMRVAMGVE